MGKLLAPLSILFRHHKLKMVYVGLFTLAFFILCFPNDDLADWVAAQVNRGGQVYLQLDGLRLELLPSPGIGADNVLFESRGQPAIKASAIHVSPVLMRLITGKVGVSAEIQKLFSGDVEIEYGQDNQAKSGARFDEVSLHAEHLSLDELSAFLRAANISGFRLQGIAKADIPKLRVDHLFAEQPSGTFSLDIQSFVIPPQTIMVNFNGVNVPQALPTLELGRISLQNAKLNEGVLEIPELAIGEPKNDLHGKLKGTVGLQLKNMGGAVFPEISNMNLTLKLIADKGFVDRNQKTVLGGFFILIPPACKQETAKGTEITCRMKINKPGEQPIFEPANEKI